MSEARPTYLFANWKMYLSYSESLELAVELKQRQKEWAHKVRMTLFPSSIAVPAVAQELKGTSISVGAQNIFWHEKGGYTGEVSAPMFQAVGAEYALIGHSERRYVFNETNREIRQKMEAVLTTTTMTPVLCIGETARERQAGQTEEVLEAQLRSAFSDIKWPAGKELVVAYEPVWSVGTGEACDPMEAERICGMVHSWIHGLIGDVHLIVLYGGSVRPENITRYIEQPNIHGVLVGASATKLDTWMEIVKGCIL